MTDVCNCLIQVFLFILQIGNYFNTFIIYHNRLEARRCNTMWHRYSYTRYLHISQSKILLVPGMMICLLQLVALKSPNKMIFDHNISIHAKRNLAATPIFLFLAQKPFRESRRANLLFHFHILAKTEIHRWTAEWMMLKLYVSAHSIICAVLCYVS